MEYDLLCINCGKIATLREKNTCSNIFCDKQCQKIYYIGNQFYIQDFDECWSNIGVKIYDNNVVYDHFMKYADQDEYLDNQTADIFYYHDWTRKKVPISQIEWSPENVSSKQSQKLINYYKTLKTKVPEIILVPGYTTKPYRIVDGYHRVAVAISRGKMDIFAFVPVKK